MKKALVSKRKNGSKILNQTQISETEFSVVRMETLAVGRSGSNVRVGETGIMRKRLTLVRQTLILFVSGSRKRMSRFSLVDIYIYKLVSVTN